MNDYPDPKPVKPETATVRSTESLWFGGPAPKQESPLPSLAPFTVRQSAPYCQSGNCSMPAAGFWRRRCVNGECFLEWAP